MQQIAGIVTGAIETSHGTEKRYITPGTQGFEVLIFRKTSQDFIHIFYFYHFTVTEVGVAFEQPR